jgi:2-pyrone-4,6-dicarboxylate lactonase
VVGLRLNTRTGGGIGLDQLERLEPVCRELGWHLQFLSNARALSEVAPQLSRLTVPYVMDHMCYPEVAAGIGSPEWKFVLDLMADGAWVKLSGAYRLSNPPYTSTIPFARSLLEAAPDRCVYGSDWPHVGCRGPMPNDGDLVDPLLATSLYDDPAAGLCGDAPAGLDEHRARTVSADEAAGARVPA